MDTYRQKLDAGEQVADVLDEPLENAHASAWSVYTGEGLPDEPDTSISVKKARQLANQLIDIPEDFILHPRVQKIIESRGKMASGKALMDWGFAETLAYASLADRARTCDWSGRIPGAVLFSTVMPCCITRLMDPA